MGEQCKKKVTIGKIPNLEPPKLSIAAIFQQSSFW